MSADWTSVILDAADPAEAWQSIFAHLLELARSGASPFALHDQTVVPDRLLSEAAWGLWAAYSTSALRTSAALREWCASPSASGRAILIIDALSLRELPLLLAGAEAHHVPLERVSVTGAECPTTTDAFAKALGLPSRGALANSGAPASFSLLGLGAHTDVTNIPFEDCSVPPQPHLLIWHSWLDDLIHLQKIPDRIAANSAQVLQSHGFWSFVDRLRQGRRLVITSDHGYAVSRLFSSEEPDPEAINALRESFGALRYRAATEEWPRRFMPPTVLCERGHQVVMGQCKWKVAGGFPQVCHGGMSLLEAAVPFLELPAR